MKIVDDVRKTVSNPKPLYFAAGVGDAAVEALKDAPARLSGVSAKAGEVAAVAATKVAGAAESVQSKVALSQFDAKALLDPKALRGKFAEPDLRAAREKAQTLLLQQVGRALEVAGKAVETYDEYSERGKLVVDRVLAGRNGADVEFVSVEENIAAAPKTEPASAPVPSPAPAATNVVVEDGAVPAGAEGKAGSETKPETKPAPAAKAEAPETDAAAKPAPAKKTASRRKPQA